MTKTAPDSAPASDQNTTGSTPSPDPACGHVTGFIAVFQRCMAFIDPQTYPQAVGLIALMIISTMLEVIGIGLVFPLVAVLSDPSILATNEWSRAIFGATANEHPSTALIMVAVGFLCAIALKNSFLLLVYFVQGRFFAKNEALLAHKLFSHYLRGDYRLHLSRNSSGLINNVTSTASTVYSHALRSFMTIATEVFLVAILAVVLLIANPLVTLGALATISVAMLAFYGVIKNRMTAWGKQATEARQQIIKILQQGLHSIKEVKILGREDFILQDFDAHRQAYAKAEIRLFVANNAPRLWVETVVIACAMLGVVFVIVQGGGSTELFSVLALFAAAAVRLIPSMNRILTSMNAIRGGTYPINILYDDLKVFQPAPRASNEDKIEKLPFNESLTLENVSFSYPNSDVHAVTDISLRILKGESVGFVGPSGSGKTTLVDIILGLLPPESGRTLADGVDTRSNLEAWQANVSYVPQSIYLFDDTLRRNIAFALQDKDISDEHLNNAVQLAQLDDLVRSLPDGLDTNVGERGARLSGGQRQRVGIARALYRDPEVLVLDEATSALDSETEHEINKVIDGLSGRKTVITIAHRLSTVRRCDHLVFLENGRISNTGTFDELTKNNATFRNLVELSKL